MNSHRPSNPTAQQSPVKHPANQSPVLRTLQPGDKGTRRFLKEHGDRLVCVRYRKAKDNSALLTTIELIVDKKPARLSGLHYNAIDAERNRQWVAIRVDYHETALREQIKHRGARWDQMNKFWRMPYREVVAMGLIERVISPEITSI